MLSIAMGYTEELIEVRALNVTMPQGRPVARHVVGQRTAGQVDGISLERFTRPAFCPNHEPPLLILRMAFPGYFFFPRKILRNAFVRRPVFFKLQPYDSSWIFLPMTYLCMSGPAVVMSE